MIDFSKNHPTMDITEHHVRQLILIRKRGIMNGEVALIAIIALTPDGKFQALKVNEGDGELVPFIGCKWLNASDYEIIDPMEASKKPDIDPATGCPKSGQIKRFIIRALRLFKLG